MAGSAVVTILVVSRREAISTFPPRGVQEKATMTSHTQRDIIALEPNTVSCIWPLPHADPSLPPKHHDAYPAQPLT